MGTGGGNGNGATGEVLADRPGECTNQCCWNEWGEKKGMEELGKAGLE